MTTPGSAPFVFGAASAAAQIEGSVDADGRGPSVWDAFAAEAGRIADGSTPAIACDHYRRWEEDIALLADLGVDAYRFSVAWPRICPDGTGPINPAGLAFYDRLVDALLERGIEPWVTLFHWDMPQAMMSSGGWLDRGSVDAFARYVTAVADALGDRVSSWMTLNEPVVHAGYGYALGIEAPGLSLAGAAFPATHHQLLAHGRAAAILRGTTGRIGIVNNHTVVRPASEDDADLLAAGMYDIYHNTQYSQPILTGSYPDALALMPGVDLDCVADGDLAEISAPLDFYGVNYYQPTVVAAGDESSGLPFDFVDPASGPVTDFGWPIDAAALTELLVGMKATYPEMPPIVITENGAYFEDDHAADGTLAPDTLRMAFIDEHLAAVEAAIADGVDVRGYFHWSLTDNWEWAAGYTPRFGLVRVDYDTQMRTPRASFAHFRGIIARRRAGRG